MRIENGQLSGIAAQMAEATARVQRFRERPEETFRRRPRSEAWSAAECVRHLSLTGHAYLPIVDEALSRTDRRRVGVSHRYRLDLAGWCLTWLMEPPFRTKTKTSAPFVPIDVGSQASAISEFETMQAALLTRVERCVGRDLEHLRVASAFNASVRYNLYSALTILMAHERRHLWQADRALAAGQGTGAA